jgi:phage nucleotide-binding protein
VEAATVPPATPSTLITPANFIKASQLVDKWGLNLLVYGQAGAGKTVFASTADDVEAARKVLYIDVEGGTRSIADRENIDVFSPDDFDDIKKTFRFLKDSEHEYRTVVLDSLTEAQRLGLAGIMRTSKTPDMPGLQDYGKSNEEIQGLVRAFRGLAQSKGINVIFTALDVEAKDEVTGAVLVRPALTPKAAEMVTGIVDGVGHMYVNTNGERMLRLAQDARILAKIRQPMTGPRIPDVIENPTVGAILSHYGK